MHLGNGAITPECGLVALGVAAIGAGVGIVAARTAGVDRTGARTAGALGAAVFAAQMFNVQILPFSSAHLVGGALLAWTLGPGLGLLSMTIVLTLQALLLGDGGLLALGCNVINMGLAPSLLVAIVKRSGLHDSRHATLLVGAIAFVATMLGAGFISLEVACGRDASELGGWTTFAGRMFAAHACVGLLEGLATMAIVTLLASAKHSRNAAFRLSRPQVVAVAIASLALILVSLPQLGIASAAPDAYQASLAEVARAGYALGDIESPDRLSGIATAAQSCQDALTLSLPEPLMAALGALLAGGGACLGGLLLSRRPTPLAG